VPIELVIFDCDGVLVDSEPLANGVFANHLNRLGLRYNADTAMLQFMGKSMKTCMAEVAQQLYDHRLPVPADFPNGFLANLQSETFAVLAEEVQAVDGVASAIAQIQTHGIKTCVASSGDHAKMQVTLGRTGLVHLFGDSIFSATQVTHGKPAPDLFLFAAAQMGVSQQHCLVVEDSPFGLLAAVSAGMRAVGYAARSNSDQLLSNPQLRQAFNSKQIRLVMQMHELPQHVLPLKAA
jgi:HAD superfamily hydrolase (TIGR01509 family)